MSEPEDGNFHFYAVTPMSGNITIYDDRYTANSIADALKEGVLEMQANTCDDFGIFNADTGEHIATVEDYAAEEGHLDGFLFIEHE